MYLNITYDSLDPKWTRSGGKVLVISNILYIFVTAKIKKQKNVVEMSVNYFCMIVGM